ncbi:MAG: OmpH family outer membrane protein [Betaproteobacteria bacterium]
MSLSRYVSALSMAVCLVSASPVALAQITPKVGFVNTERILRDAVPAKAAQTKLEAEFSRRERELQELGNRLRQLGERLERDAMVMSETERGRRQREVADLDKDFQRRQREFREDLNQRRNEELSQVVERANRVIRQIAEKEKFDLIFQEAVYASGRIDITDLVLQALSDPAAK